jgi:hypothetical protein
MQGKAAYVRPKVVGPLPRPGTNASYVHQAAPFIDELGFASDAYCFQFILADSKGLSSMDQGKFGPMGPFGVVSIELPCA